MPEGPELLRSADQLQCLVGSRIATIGVIGGRYRDRFPDGLAEFMQVLSSDRCEIAEVMVKGKFMWWRIHQRWAMWCTYGMSGQWSFLPGKHAAVGIACTDGTTSKTAYFNDPRHFGTLRFVHDPKGDKTDAKRRSLGPDMLNDPPTHDFFAECIRFTPKRTLAEALMDQRCVSGVGNYVKAEALWLARLSPHRRCDGLDYDELARLCDAVTGVMLASYRSGGATISTYRNVDGEPGEAQRRFAVYGHTVDPLGNPVVREATKDGRTTWWSPAIQR